MNNQKKNFILVSKRNRWGLTIWGWSAIFLLLFVLTLILLRNIYSFLAPVQRADTDVLVLEGFVSDYVLADAIREFETHHYQLLITTGTPLEWGHLLLAWENTAKLAASSLKKMGFDSTRLVVVSTDIIQNDRTYNSALELKSYLNQFHPDIKAINLMTMSVHGRRSQLLFHYALGDSIRVGIISAKSLYYNKDNWWKNSKGFREVMNETFAYFYVKLFFMPYSKPEF